MPVTVFVNSRGVVHKGSGGMSIVFPDVCKTPTPGGPVPIPYPNIAKTALATQKKTASKPGAVKSPFSTMAGGGKALGKAPASDAVKEIQELRTMLNQLNVKLQGLPTHDPDQWQKVLQDYVVAASALYVTARDKN